MNAESIAIEDPKIVAILKLTLFKAVLRLQCFFEPPLKTGFAAQQCTETNTVCNILGQTMAKQFVVASISIKYFNSAATFYSITK